MAHPANRRFPRGINFLLGGTVVAIGFIVFAIVGGSFSFGLGSAPSVRIDSPAGAASASSR